MAGSSKVSVAGSGTGLISNLMKPDESMMPVGSGSAVLEQS